MRFVRLDVTDEDSITAAAEHVDEQSGALDVLVNNADVAVRDGEGRPSSVHLETLRQTFEVNFYGTLRVTQAFLPLVHRSQAGRIVKVSSTLGSIATVVAPSSPPGRPPFFFAYPASKTLLNALTGWLALELRDTAIKVNSVCPGSNATRMNPDPEARHPAEGAKVVVGAATLPADGPSGTFIDVNGPVGW